MTSDLSQWHVTCLIRELDKRMTNEKGRDRASRYYVFQLIRDHKPRAMTDSCGAYTLGHLTKHLLAHWSTLPSEFDDLHSALQLKIDQWEQAHGKIPY